MGETKKKYKLHHHEIVDVPGGLARVIVPGGWLYRETWGDSGGICFVPDPNVEIEEKP